MCIYSSFFYAYLGAFGIPKSDSSSNQVDKFFIIIFSVDTCLRFFINDFELDSIHSEDLKEIAYAYIKGGFFFDFITTVPFIRFLDG
jgi:hypothetical protein